MPKRSGHQNGNYLINELVAKSLNIGKPSCLIVVILNSFPNKLGK